jgi:hypothetical protein
MTHRDASSPSAVAIKNEQWRQEAFEEGKVASLKDKPMNALDLILDLHEVCQFRSQERGPGPASNSELRRILDQNGFHINGKPHKCKDTIVFPIQSLVLFPASNKRRTTLL